MLRDVGVPSERIDMAAKAPVRRGLNEEQLAALISLLPRSAALEFFAGELAAG